MYKNIVNELGILVSTLDGESLSPILISDKFESIIGSSSDDIFNFFEDKNTSFSKEIALGIDDKSPYKFFAQIKDGRTRMSIEFEVTRNYSGGLTIYGKDVTDLKKLEYSLQSYSSIMEKQDKMLHEMAYTDVLTGAPNRRSIFEKFEEYAADKRNILGSVCILDIDHFKQFNDRYGHEFGDYILKYFSGQVANALDKNSFFARIGGEEFCVFSYNCTGTELNVVIDGILDSIKDGDILTPEQEVTNISFSAGIAEYSADGTTLDELLNKADKALYFAKAAGRSRVISFSTELFEKRDDTLIPKYRDGDR